MKNDEVIIRVGGAAGDGVQSAGLILAKVFSRSGMHVNTYNYYQSIIRGGQSWYQIRASHREVRSQGDGLDVLIALNKDALERHTNPKINEGGASALPKEGVAIMDSSMTGYKEFDVDYTPVPLGEIALKYSKNTLLKNTVAIGAAMGSLQMNFDILADVIRDQFGKKGDIAEQNVKAAKEGYDYYSQKYKKIKKDLKVSNEKRYLIAGGEAAGLGAATGGLKMYFGYPMTPASSILHFLAEHSTQYGVFVKITEDEISAINMAIGANYAGVRAMTGSSGGGFSLMTEALGMAGMVEVPLVVYEAQRAGPSTGLPTKTEQGDLMQVIGASQGDYPKVILAPRNIEELFNLTREALNIAERYQMPVILMVDLYLAEHYETISKPNLEFKIDHGKRAQDNQKDYRRYAYSDDGISARAIPGQPGLMHNEDSDEHNEFGDVVSDAETDPTLRMLSMEKRMKKMETYAKEIPATPMYRADDAEYMVVQWGSTQGAVEEAIDILREKGLKVGALEIFHVHPFNRDIEKKLSGRKKIIVVENNFSGQLNRLLKSEFSIKTELITKYDGESFYPEALSKEIEKKIGGN